MTALFTLAEANALLPEVEERLAGLVAIQKGLEREVARHPVAPRADSFRSAAAFDLNETAHRVLGWFQHKGIHVKGLEPPLVDFPARARIGDVLLCWRQGEESIGYYHLPQAGFGGRRPVSELEGI